MLNRKEWFVDTRPLRTWGFKHEEYRSWEWSDWCKAHPKPREQWLMSIIETLLKNQDWAGSYLLIQTYLTTLKQTEGATWYNRTPTDESTHVRAVRHWFWSLAEENGFTERDDTCEPQDINTRRSSERAAEESYPFVGGKPKRRYSESAEFFQQVVADRKRTQEAQRLGNLAGQEKRKRRREES